MKKTFVRHAFAVALSVLAAKGAAAASWSRASFSASDGTEIHYLYRAGEGSPILLVHGLGVGADGFALWRDFFPGRPMMILERRGYGSALGGEDAAGVGATNRDDVSRAVDEARRVSVADRVGLLGYSLGALLLPPPDPARVRWLALACPGVPGMARDMPAAERSLEAQTRYWFGVARAGGPAALGAWLVQAISPAAVELSAKLASLGLTAASEWLAARAYDTAFLNLYTRESLWAYAQDAGFDPQPAVPVFIGYAENDQVVPPAAVRRRARQLSAGAEPTTVVHWPGDHLDALADPALIRSRLEKFDAEVAP